MQREILPVTLENKKRVIQHVRETIIPQLTTRDYSSEQVLQILHRTGTFYSQPGNYEQALLNEDYTAFYAGLDYQNIPREELRHQLKIQQQQTDGYTVYCYPLKGNYRILGCFPSNPQIAQHAPEAETFFTGAIPIENRDYHTADTILYSPPVFNIHKLMSSISTNFDQRFNSSSNPHDIALNVADFYFWGLAMVHPFIGGNHRAFDRFIEYAFAKNGIQLQTPQDQTLNIRPDDPFNKELFLQRRKLIYKWGLDTKKTNLSESDSLNKWLEYQHRLNEEMVECIDTGCADTSKIAQAIISWL